MNETKYSSSSSPADSWAHEFYNQPATMYGGGRDHRVFSDATVISTTACGSTATSIASPNGPSSTSSTTTTTASQYLMNVPSDQGGGRVSKPTRRRSRASRRTPTTLLNTDTTNFRAMVQQFTGGPTPYASTAAGSHPHYRPLLGGGANFSFGVETQNQVFNPTTSGAYYFQQQQPQQQQQEQPYYHQQQHQPYMFSFMNNSRPDMEEMNDHAAGGFSMDHVTLPLPRPPS